MQKRTFIFLLAISLIGPFSTVGKWSWQEIPVEITETGDFKWKPEPYQYSPGNIIRYIDYENGDDTNSGTSPTSPWKHHPWDPEATANAIKATGIDTYVFKRGSIYRGRLIARESGRVQNPIRLTSNPDWGNGEAFFYGSERVISQWYRGRHPDMPEEDTVWYTDLSYAPRCVWLIDGTTITSLALARTPNWQISDSNHVKSEWWQWQRTGTSETDTGKYQMAIDSIHLTMPRDYYVGGLIYSSWFLPGMPYASKVLDFDEVRKIITFTPPPSPWSYAYVRSGDAYYFEDKPQYLDTTGEFWFDKAGDGGRLYVRLPEEKDPNSCMIEAASRSQLIGLTDCSNITISGLTFRFTNVHWDLTARIENPDVTCAVIRMRKGSGTGITVKNCIFEYVNKAVRIEPLTDTTQDAITINDNQIQHTSHAAIEVLGRSNVEVYRNKLYDIANNNASGSDAQSILLDSTFCADVAGNIVHFTYGAGMHVGNGGKPLNRTFVHHNKISDPMLSICDAGGITIDSGGPTYVYCNISGNPGGLRYGFKERWGHSYYFGATHGKTFFFNNVAWGEHNEIKSPESNIGALFELYGMENVNFNNTFYKFERAFMRGQIEAERNSYIGNLLIDISDYYFSHPGVLTQSSSYERPEPVYDSQTIAYAHNVFFGPAPKHFAAFEPKFDTYCKTIDEFRKALKRYKVLCAHVGIELDRDPMIDAERHDFRLKENSPATDKGAKVFVPFPLYTTIGEWHFHRNNTDPTHCIDDHWYVAPYYPERPRNYKDMPRFPLTAVGVNSSDYHFGFLESWTESALHLNGIDQYAFISHKNLTRDIKYGLNYTDSVTISGEEIVSANMDTNNFIIEVYFKTGKNHTGGCFVAKYPGNTGYVLGIDKYGNVELVIGDGESNIARRCSRSAVNDGAWHHVIAEIDRSDDEGMHLYIDGKLSDGIFEGIMPTGSLNNTGDLLVGGGPGMVHFAGALDFLRISRGTLADAQTTIEELYAWQFTDGPHFFDIMGKPVMGKLRDAGAFEGDSIVVAIEPKHSFGTEAARSSGVPSTLKSAAEMGIKAGKE